MRTRGLDELRRHAKPVRPENTRTPEMNHAAEEAPIHTMQCMEVWGGNTAVESGISMTGVDAWVYSQPYRAQAAGGDIHYVSMCGMGRIGRFFLADVAGHGAEVSGLAAKLRTLMRKSINRPDQTRIARGLNRALGHLGARGIFATAAMLTYFAPTDQLLCCLAGHPRPLWYKAQTRRWRLLGPTESDTLEFQGLPLGIIHPTEYRQFAVTLNRGDLVIAYTDSLIESHAAGQEPLGEEGLLSLVETMNAGEPAQFGHDLIAAVDRASGGTVATRDDDLTLLVLHHNATDPKPVSLGHRLRMMAKMLGM